jgi:hypothetical protein
MLFALLEMVEPQSHGFMPPHPQAALATRRRAHTWKVWSVAGSSQLCQILVNSRFGSDFTNSDNAMLSLKLS